MTSDDPSWRIISDDAYEKEAKKFLGKHPDLVKKYLSTIQKVQADPHDRSLQTHPLHGALKETFGVRLTASYRLTIAIVVSERAIYLLSIGDHNAVYR